VDCGAEFCRRSFLMKALRECDEAKAVLDAERMCDVCGGTGKPLSGLKCICGGSGKTLDALQGYRNDCHNLQQQVHDLEVKLAEMRVALESSRNYLNCRVWMAESPYGSGEHPTTSIDRELVSKINNALSTDAGKGWVSPEEHRRLVDEFARPLRIKLDVVQNAVLCVLDELE